MQALEDIKRIVGDLARERGALKAIIFGSLARGTATSRSDVDILIVEETDLPYLRRIDRYFDPLVDRLDRTVEVLVYTPGELERRADLPFVKKALAEGVVAYERGKV